MHVKYKNLSCSCFFCSISFGILRLGLEALTSSQRGLQRWKPLSIPWGSLRSPSPINGCVTAVPQPFQPLRPRSQEGIGPRSFVKGGCLPAPKDASKTVHGKAWPPNVFRTVFRLQRFPKMRCYSSTTVRENSCSMFLRTFPHRRLRALEQLNCKRHAKYAAPAGQAAISRLRLRVSQRRTVP